MEGFSGEIGGVVPQEQQPELEFVYVDATKEEEGKYLFRCNAVSVEEADNLFKAKIGFDPTTDSNIELVQIEKEN